MTTTTHDPDVVAAANAAQAAAAEQPAGVPLRRTTYTLRFDDGDLAGQVVRARTASASGRIDIAHAGQRPTAEQALAGPEMADRMYRLFRAFAGSLLSWTLADDESGEPIPATLHGLLSLDFGHAVGVTHAWLDAVAGDMTEPDLAAVEADLQLPVEALA